MDNVYFPDFIRFINRQPADQVIVHNLGWSRCAVGEYAATLELVGVESPGREVAAELCRQARAAKSPASPEERLMNLLNQGEFETYGELQAWIKHNSN